MSRTVDYISIGPAPYDEMCEQLGMNYDPAKARRECQCFINQLRREFGPEPFGARLRIKFCNHDFGTYLDVVCDYEDDASADYAFKIEGNTPATWDEIAKKELYA